MQHFIINRRSAELFTAFLLVIGTTIATVIPCSVQASETNKYILNNQPSENSDTRPFILAYLDENPTPLEQSEFDDLIAFAKSQVGGIVRTTSDKRTFEEWTFAYESGANSFTVISTDNQWLENLKSGLLLTRTYWLEYINETDDQFTIYLNQDLLDYLIDDGARIPNFIDLLGEVFRQLAMFYNCVDQYCTPALAKCLPPGMTFTLTVQTTPPGISLSLSGSISDIVKTSSCVRNFAICESACFTQFIKQ